MATELKAGDKIRLESARTPYGSRLEATITEVIYVKDDYLQTFNVTYLRTSRWNWAYLGNGRYRLAPVDPGYFSTNRIAQKVDA